MPTKRKVKPVEIKRKPFSIKREEVWTGTKTELLKYFRTLQKGTGPEGAFIHQGQVKEIPHLPVKHQLDRGAKGGGLYRIFFVRVEEITTVDDEHAKKIAALFNTTPDLTMPSINMKIVSQIVDIQK